MEDNICPVCGRQAHIQTAQQYFAKVVQCKKCGIFYIEHDILDNDSLEPKIRASMYYYLIHNIINHQPKPNEHQKIFPHFILRFNFDKKIYNDHYYISKEALLNIYPNSFSDLINKILINIADLSDGFSGSISYNEKSEDLIRTIFFINDLNKENNIENTFDILKEMNLIKLLKNSTLNEYIYKLTANAWERIEKLENIDKILNKTFIAMCFKEELHPLRETIKKSVEHCGYIPIVIDEKQYNGQIVPEIFHEIKNSKFVIADLTKHRRGVYYEAGYAEALGKEVILTCKKSDFRGVHFDVAQKSIIKWESEEDLEKRLIDRITATIGKLNN
ncbi:MAG: hypothetical protein GYA50_06395 [Eubacteriaceae bacterium]|nr:hypothetical protein [Eubacteriaceae bacterium]